MEAISLIPIETIRLDFQTPDRIDDMTVQQYIASIESGTPIEPIRVYFDGQEYWLADGFHRVQAMRSLGRREIDAELVPGTFADLEAEWSLCFQELKRRA
jgi:ParB-like chromosome segregation protein Spo0J